MINVNIEFWILLTEGDDYFFSESIEGFATSSLDYGFLEANIDRIPELVHGEHHWILRNDISVLQLWEILLEYVDFGGLAEECKFPCFLIDNHIIHIQSEQYKLETLLTDYVYSNRLKALFIVCNAAGDVFRDDGLRYYFNSHEAGKHHIPHIHVDYLHENSGTYSIITGERLEGDIPRRIEKKIRKRILENRQMLIEWWNNRTDGIFIDLNHEFEYRSIRGM